MDSESHEPLPGSSSVTDSPISRLHLDLLWNIFSLNSTDTSWYSHSERSPLTTTRKCSQVCVLWRQIIVDSPSIWGNCMDLDLLGQERSDWRDEVLRRTGSAPLCVQARYAKAVRSNTDIHKFLVDLIDAHWERIQVFDIHVQSRKTLNDARVWSAFSRPAPNLRMFSLSSSNKISIETIARPFPKHSLHLFSDKAPVLGHFSLYDTTIVMPISVHPFPPALLSGNLRHLSLHQPTAFAAIDLLTACEQMPHLEVLQIVISRLIADDPQNEYMYSHRKINLPSLKTITVAGPGLEIYPAFFGRIITHPGCSLSVDTTLSRTGTEFPETKTANVREMLRVFLQYSNGFLNYYQEGQNEVAELSLSILQGFFKFTSYRNRYYFRMLGTRQEEIPQHILDMVLTTMAALKFSCAIDKLILNMSFINPEISNATSLKLFQALGSVKELTTSLRTLSDIHRVALFENAVLFPSLKVLYLRGLQRIRNKEQLMKPFLVSRHNAAPIEVLDLTRSRGLLGDLRFLDELTGLKLVWMENRVLHEYICGSGNLEVLSFRNSSPTSSDSESFLF
ncbi:hypothetical protein BDN70DRAFT_884007 [Pholiota conissans]|uniref:F-box domain-containing protein n=1 Tax=Pholiota conissans TaxID=109636 RepID=A0A9P6CX31_9AGAR|nr:hypothetical protein BDN70DRAFT_884007 [Pholiota conissans]